MHERLSLLTPREGAVLGHLMKGHTVREIAIHSYVSEATVRTQVKSILSKLQVSSQIAAVGLAHRVGWRPLAIAVYFARSRASSARPTPGRPCRHSSHARGSEPVPAQAR